LGVRDVGLLESALARAPNRWGLDETADLPDLAASYCFGIAKNHPFLDGNKRVAFQIMFVFLGLNGLQLTAKEVEVVRIMVDLAAGSLTEAELASWIRGHV
jgi:death on curing protein